MLSKDENREVIIYKLSAEGKDYYGSTVLPLLQRVQIHTRDSSCQAYKEGITNNKDLKWEVVERTTEKFRVERETYYIRNFPCVNKAGKYDTPDELKERRKKARDKYFSVPENREKAKLAKFEKREARKADELKKQEGIKIRKGVIVDRPMHENLPKDVSEELIADVNEADYVDTTTQYTPFGVDNPEMNALYEKHREYIEKKLSELKYLTKERTYFCTDCNKRLASSAPVVLRRHFCSYKHLINSFQMETHEKPIKERKPYVRKPRPANGSPSESLQQSFQESLDEGYVFSYL